MKRFYLITYFLFIFMILRSQEISNKWDYQLSNIRTFDVVNGNKKTYFLSDGGVYYFNEADNSLESITKINGLSGSDFQGIDYNYSTNSLVITYKNSMVDVISSDGTIYPFSDIKRKNIAGNKAIYNATCYKDYCYLSCGFGIVVIDLVKLEIKDSFIIGDEGNYQPVYDIAFDTENIYAGTDEGIKFAPLNSPNLLDFSYWSVIQKIYLDGYSIHQLKENNGRIWAVHNADAGLWHGDRIFSRHGADVWYPEYTETGIVHDLTTQGDKIVISSFDGITIYQVGVGKYLKIDEYPFMKDSVEMMVMSAILDTKGDVWIADYNYGAIRYSNGAFERYTLAGPIDNDAFSLTYSNNKLWIAGGGRDLKWDPIFKGFTIQSYSEGKWDYINNSNQPDLDKIRDAIQILPTLSDPDHVYVATWGSGLLEFNKGVLVNHFTNENSTLLEAGGVSNMVRVGGLDFDSKGNLWMSNSEVQNCLQKYSPAEKKWQSYLTSDIAFNYKVGSVLVDKDDNIWTIVPREKTFGLYVMSNDGQQKKHLDVVGYFDNGDQISKLDMNNVHSFAKDNIGDIWVGTSKGIAVYSNTEDVFITDPYYAYQPALDLNDDIYHPLLANETVSAIVVDGGNRKWCGTKESGLYLISEDGKEELEHYTTENSKLISDAILSLEFDGDKGILYIGTELGLVSLRTDSKASFDRFKNVYAYPNPVRSGYQGNIYISGMMENSNVKITTVSGRLVFETTSLGGQAVWDGNDLAGNRVATGVYLAFCASSDGQESTVTKILFIR